jgi:hypothetical protein
MSKSAQKRPPGQFAASGRREKEALAAREKSRLVVAEHVAGLRALRLAKEAADRKAAAAAKAAPTKAT